MVKKSTQHLDESNAQIMAELISDVNTTEHLRVNIITKLLESREGNSFFRTIFEEGLSFASCPNCGHQNHWAIPEDDLNEMNWITHEKDSRVPRNTDSKSCPKYQEACGKKRITI